MAKLLGQRSGRSDWRAQTQGVSKSAAVAAGSDRLA